MANRYYTSGAVATTLTASLSSVTPGATGSVQVTSITGYPTSYPFTLLLDWGTTAQEVVTVTQAATGTGPYTYANSVRGDDGTAAPAHTAPTATVVHGVSARDFTDPQTHLGSSTGVHGVSGALASLLTQTAVQTGSYTAAANQVVPVNTTTGSVTVTLPAVPPPGTLLAVKHIIQGGTNTVTVACGGSDVFNKTGGSTSMTLTLLNQGVLLQYNSGIWTIVADDLPLTQLDARYAPAALPGRVPYVLNVRLGYGGVGANYSTDDTAAILAAITDAQAAASITGTMPVVYLPYGMWKITAAIPLPPSITFRGDGPRSTYLRQFTANTDVIQMLGTDSSHENSLVTLEGMGVSGTSSGTGCGINMAWAQNVTLRDIGIANAGSHGLQMSNCWDLNAYNVRSFNNYGSGISAVTGINNCNFTGCLFSANALDGVTFNGGASTSFINCDIEANGHHGINFVMTYGGLVMGCDFEGNNTSLGAYCNIYVEGRKYNGGPTILGNNFSGGSKTPYSVYIASDTYNTTLQGNEFGNNTTGDVYIQSGTINTLLLNNNYEPFGGSSTPTPGVSDSGTNTTTVGGAAVPMEPNLPTDYGWLAWNGDPDTAAMSVNMGTTGTPTYTAGIAYHARINVRGNSTVGHIIIGWWNGTGVGLVNSYLSLYNSSGTLIDYTADISDTSSGMISVALAGGAHLLNPGWYEAGIVIGTQNGTTPAGALFFSNAITSETGSFANMGITAGVPGVRWSTGATGRSSWETSITTHAASTVPFFCALAG